MPVHIGLFAPRQLAAYGGVWQFAQLIAFQVGVRVPMHLVLPQALLEDMAAVGPLPVGVTATPSGRFLETVHASLAFRVLEAGAWGGVLGMRVPLYGKTTRYARRVLYGGSVESSALVRDLKAHDVDVVHVPCQGLSHALIGRRYPYVINPHDYQHEHFPEFFTEKELADRRGVWYAAQRRAAAVVVHSVQTRDDAVKYLGIPEERVFYVPYGPLATFPEMDEARARAAVAHLGLPERFIFYPARMWPHKNHLGLVEALAELKGRGVEVDCVFTDASGDHAARVRARTVAHGLEKQVRAVGRVTPEVMGALYTLCTAVVVPSLFEQNSAPMLEAVQLGKALAVSHLPEMVSSLDGAGLVFDPHSPAEIARAVDALWSSDRRRSEVEAAVRDRRDAMSWEPFREVYHAAYAYALERGNP